MKKFVRLKLIVFILFLVASTITYSAPTFGAGTTENSTVAGINNTASGYGSSAFGYANKIYGDYSSSFGVQNIIGKTKSDNSPDKNYGKRSMVLGSYYQVTGNYSGVFGLGANSPSTINEGNNSYMIGNRNRIAKGSDDNFILGNDISIASGIKQSVVLGTDSTVSESNTVSVGSSSQQRKIVNVANGTADTDAATVGQVKKMIDTNTSSLTADVNNLKNDISNRKSDMNNVKSKVTTLETDVNSLKSDMSGVKTDVSNLKSDMNNVKGRIGNLEGKVTNVEEKVTTVETKVDTLKTNIAGKVNVDASNLNNDNITKWREKLKIVDGVVNTATGTGSTGLGVDNTVSGDYSTAVGYKNNVSGNHSGAFGVPNTVTGNNSYAFGNDNIINGDNNFVLGNNVTIASGIQNSVALGNNSTVSSSNEVSFGSSTLKRKITNIADGEVSATSTDAINGRQLYKEVEKTNTKFEGFKTEVNNKIDNIKSEVDSKIDNVKNEVNHVGSLSAALAGLHPMQYDPKAPAQVMAALGHYKNRQSVAIGLSYYFNDKFMMNTGIAIGSERRVKSMVNIGFTLKLGKGSAVIYTESPQYVVQSEVKRLSIENQELKAKLNQQENKINIQGIENKELKDRVKNLEDKLNMLLKTK